ncbi:MAG: lysoplasmalogenase [Clostridium sp.]|jgi:uncharacterized membrane protein YhhN|nr:lysoplasmalogenase [Clostridium sp.]
MAELCLGLGLLSLLIIVVRVFPSKSQKGEAGGFGAKVLSSLLFCAAGLAAVYGKELTLPRAAMLGAFVLAFMGDVFLGLGPFSLEKHKNFLFIMGSVPFLLAQLLYIAVLLSLAPFDWRLLPLAFVLPLMLLIFKWRGVLAYLCENTIPIICYGAILGAMVVAAANALLAGHSGGSLALCAGLLFALSDTSLFLYNFGSDRVRAHKRLLTASVMLPYYAAQALFALVLTKI